MARNFLGLADWSRDFEILSMPRCLCSHGPVSPFPQPSPKLSLASCFPCFIFRVDPPSQARLPSKTFHSHKTSLGVSGHSKSLSRTRLEFYFSRRTPTLSFCPASPNLNRFSCAGKPTSSQSAVEVGCKVQPSPPPPLHLARS